MVQSQNLGNRMLCKSFIISNEPTVHTHTHTYTHPGKENGKEADEGEKKRNLTFESDKQQNGSKYIPINNYFKCKRAKCSNQKT